jgi:hypothetical protein
VIFINIKKTIAMKHLLNDLSNEEKNRIREQYEGGMTIDPTRFKNLMESKLGNVKPLTNEQTNPKTKYPDLKVNPDGDPKTTFRKPTITYDKTSPNITAIKAFQDWMDLKHPFWIKEADGSYKNMRKGTKQYPTMHRNGSGWGTWGPSSERSWQKYRVEYLTYMIEKDKKDYSPEKRAKFSREEGLSPQYPYYKLDDPAKPTPEFIADIIKKSYGGLIGDDKEAWAESAFNAIKTKEVYGQVSKILGQDTYKYIKSFMDTKQKHHKNPLHNNYVKLFPIDPSLKK